MLRCELHISEMCVMMDGSNHFISPYILNIIWPTTRSSVRLTSIMMLKFLSPVIYAFMCNKLWATVPWEDPTMWQQVTHQNINTDTIPQHTNMDTLNLVVHRKHSTHICGQLMHSPTVFTHMDRKLLTRRKDLKKQISKIGEFNAILVPYFDSIS